MKVTSVSWQGFALPFRRPYTTATTQAVRRYGLLLCLRTDTGLTGVGEVSPVGVGSVEEVQHVAAHLERVAPRLLDTDPTSLNAWRSLTDTSMHSVARFGMETALLDLAGKARGGSVAELLGGTPGPLPVNALIAAGTPQEAQAEAQAALAMGFTSLKLKVGVGTVQQDEETVEAVRRTVGPGVRLRVDANGGWTAPQAIQAIRRLARYKLEYVEQPVAATDVEGLREVRRTTPVPVAADEALGSVDDAHRLIAAEAADLFIIKGGRLGGLSAAIEVIRLARQAEKPVVVTSSLESGVGVAASAHLAATLSAHPFAHGLATGLLLERDLLSSPLVPEHGTLPLPQGPGLGIRVDEDALSRYGIGIMGQVGSR